MEVFYRIPGPNLRPLEGSEIRLVKISPTLCDGLINCRVIYANLDDHPEFYALSYVWGDPGVTVPILVNNTRVNVSKNLHSALSRFRAAEPGQGAHDPSPHDKAWWIDAICIRQDDLQEKSFHVPRMPHIYSTATKVWAWLGLGDEVNNLEIRLLFNLGNHLSDGHRIATQVNHFLGSNMLLTDLFEPLKDVLRHPWFQRRWTLQEAVMANGPKSLWLDVGFAILPFEDFEKLVEASAVGEDMYSNHSLRGSHSTISTLGKCLTDIATLRKRQARLMNPQQGAGPESSDGTANHIVCARDIRALLGIARHRAATIPHDLLYSILGLVRHTSSLPDSLKPDYSTDCMVVSQRYTRFIMESTGFLDLLHYSQGDTSHDPPSSPSWVPNFAQKPAFSKPRNQGTVEFSDNGEVLIAQGLIVDRGPFGWPVIKTLLDWLRSSVTLGTPHHLYQALMIAFNCICVSGAEYAGLRVTPTDIMVEWMTGIGLAGTDRVNRDDWVQFCRAVEQAERQERTTGYNPGQITQLPFFKKNTDLLLERLMGTSVMVSRSGGIVVFGFEPSGQARIHAGDVIAAIKGTTMPVILRPPRPGRKGLGGPFRLVGSCYLVSSAGGGPGTRRSFDEEYFEGKELRPIHIH